MYYLTQSFSNAKNWEKKKKVPSPWEGEAGLYSPGSPQVGWRGDKASPSFSQFCILSQLHCSFAANKNLCGPLKISSILSTIIYFSIFSCLSVGAGTIWYWEYRTRADRLQYHVKGTFSSRGSLHFIICSSCVIFMRLSKRFLTLNSDSDQRSLLMRLLLQPSKFLLGPEREMNSQHPDLYMKKRKFFPPHFRLSTFHSLRQCICLQKECEFFFPLLCHIY